MRMFKPLAHAAVLASAIAAALIAGSGGTALAAEPEMLLPYDEGPTTSLTVTCEWNETCVGTVHKGIDFATNTLPDPNIPILAAADGTVNFVQNENDLVSGYGAHIKVNHGDGLITIYAHLKLDSIPWSQDDPIKAGQQVGLADNTGRSTGNHLHFETQKNGAAVNPNTYFSLYFASNQGRWNNTDTSFRSSRWYAYNETVRKGNSGGGPTSDYQFPSWFRVSGTATTNYWQNAWGETLLRLHDAQAWRVDVDVVLESAGGPCSTCPYPQSQVGFWPMVELNNGADWIHFGWVRDDTWLPYQQMIWAAEWWQNGQYGATWQWPYVPGGWFYEGGNGSTLRAHRFTLLFAPRSDAVYWLVNGQQMWPNPNGGWNMTMSNPRVSLMGKVRHIGDFINMRFFYNQDFIISKWFDY